MLVAGLAVAGSDLVVADKLGDLLYAALATFGAWLLTPRARAVVLGGVAAVWCLAVELLQLTGLPAAWDLPAYAVGLLVALGVVRLSRRP